MSFIFQNIRFIFLFFFCLSSYSIQWIVHAKNTGSNNHHHMISLNGKIIVDHYHQPINPSANDYNGDLSPFVDPRTRILINGHQIYHVKRDGSFQLNNLTPNQEYLLQVISSTHEFDPIRLTVSSSSSSAIASNDQSSNPFITVSLILPGTNWDKKGPILTTDPLLILKPKQKYNFFTQRESFNVMSILSNPMMLMTGFSLLMMYALPKMMENMDPDALKELQQQQQKNPQPQISLPDISQFMANCYAGEESKSSSKKK